MRRWTAFAVALVLMAATGACGGADATPIATPSGTVVTETFNGTVALPIAGVLQAGIHNFTVTVAGSLSVTLTAAGPPPTITMLLAIGNPSATGSCSILSGGSTPVVAGSTAQLSGTVEAGTYCVAVGDLGNALQPIAYTVTVAHT